MATKKVGTLIKEARTNAGLTQEALARKVKGLTAADIGKAERGEKALTQEQLKLIAKATGVTQKSLLDAAKGTTSTTAKKPASTAKKPASTTASRLTLTATEKKFVESYRNATAKDRKLAKTILDGKYDLKDILMQMLGNKVIGRRDLAAVDIPGAPAEDNIVDLLQFVEEDK